MALIVILARQRSGTHMLKSSIRNNTGQLFVFKNELFTPDAGKRPEGWFNFLSQKLYEDVGLAVPSEGNLNKLYRSYIEHLRKVGGAKKLVLDIKYNGVGHLNGFYHSPLDQPVLLRLLKQDQAHIVHLVRKNVLKAYCSSLRVKLTKQYQAFDPAEVKHIALTVDCADMLQEIEFRLKEIQFFQDVLKDYEFGFEMTYEDIDKNGLSKKFCDFVGNAAGEDFTVERDPDTVRMAKPLVELIGNYSEVEEVLHAHGYERFLKD